MPDRLHDGDARPREQPARRGAPLVASALVAAAALVRGSTCVSGGGGAETALSLSAADLALEAQEGGAVASDSVALSAQGPGHVSWTAASSAAWLSADPASGTASWWGAVTISVRADPGGLAPAEYQATLTVSDVYGFAAPVDLLVTFTVRAASPLYFAPAAVLLGADYDGAAAAGTTALVYAEAAPTSWTATSDAGWLLPDAASGSFSGPGSQAFGVTADPSGLASGLYTGRVTVVDDALLVPDAVLTARLYVRPDEPDCILSATPSAVTCHALYGSASPASSALLLSVTGGAGVAWEAVETETWLAVLPASGSVSEGAPAAVTLEADPTGRSVGNYATTVAFRTPGGEAADLHVRVALAVRPAANGTSCMVNYISIIDDSSQQYGLYLPSGRTPPSPVVFYMHGYGGRASASFSPTVTAKANAHGWILVNLDGRGNHFYDGAAETDLFEVLEDVDRAYGVDRSMVFLEGPSMGATGAFRHIARHPDVFAGAAGVDGWTDFNQWHRHWYAPQGSPYEFHPSRWSNLLNASCITHAENVLAGSLYLAVDGADTSVWPENGRKLHEKLTRLGTAHEYVHNASGGHCASYSQSVIHDWFHDNVPPLPADPENVRIRSNRLRTAKHAWMRIDRFVWNGFAELTAARGVGGSACSFSVTCRNVRRFTILSAPDVGSGGTYQVTVNGVACVNQPRDSTTFPLAVELDVDPTGDVVAGGLWTPSGGELAKSPEIEGPVGRALSERFVVAYGSANPAYTSKNQSEAQELCNNWADIWNSGQYGFHATIASVDEAALTRSDLTSAHLVIFGSEESSSLIQRMRYDPGLPFNLPADVLEDAVGLGPHSYVGSQYGIWMAYPNPLAPGRLVVVGHNVVGSTAGLTGAIFWTQEAYPWQWPEYVVFDTSRAIRNDVNGQKYPADQYLAAGDFGQDWGAPVAGAAETRVAVSAPASVPAGTASVTVTVTVEDELGAPVVALPGEAFDARLDGEARAAAFSEGTPGTYSPSILTSDLPAAGYDLTVEVVRPGAAGPVVGRGRARFTVY